MTCRLDPPGVSRSAQVHLNLCTLINQVIKQLNHHRVGSAWQCRCMHLDQQVAYRPDLPGVSVITKVTYRPDLPGVSVINKVTYRPDLPGVSVINKVTYRPDLPGVSVITKVTYRPDLPGVRVPVQVHLDQQ